MIVSYSDFGTANQLIASKFVQEWSELERVLLAMPLHLKASDESGIQGSAMFDSVGTNEYIKQGLRGYGWHTNLAIPPALAFLGNDIDFFKAGIIAEAQFSNYPFLLNNIIRSELFFRTKLLFANATPELFILITKDGMFRKPNSTLYYQQASSQLSALSQYGYFNVPTRLVGLSMTAGTTVAVTWTSYVSPRYSRTVTAQQQRNCIISPQVRGGGSNLTLI
jgi:hypothetical protein